VALFAFIGCAPSAGQLEARLRRELPRALGPADGYDVTIAGLRARAGQAEFVSVTGRKVRLRGAPVLDRLEVELHAVSYNRSEGRVDHVDTALAVARIRPEDLADWLETHRNVKSAQIELAGPDEARIRLRPELPGFGSELDVEVNGRMVAADGRVRFDVSELFVDGRELGSFAERLLTALVNPLVDLTETSVRLRVTGVRVEDGMVRLDATGDPTRGRPR